MTKPQSNAERVYQAVVDLRDTNRTASRHSIAELTGLKLSIVDDHIKRMRDDMRLKSVGYGIVEPVEQEKEDRALSVTHLPNGRIKLEFGEIVEDLSAREGRMFAKAFGGVSLEFGR